MAFALTAFRAYGVDVSEPVQKRALQIFECKITGTTADIALDLGDTGGTAWTAIAGGGSGTVGYAAKQYFIDILSRVDRFAGWSCLEIEGVLPALINTTATTGKYAIANNTAVTCPKWSFYTGEGLTAYNFVLRWTLKDGHRTVRGTGG